MHGLQGEHGHQMQGGQGQLQPGGLFPGGVTGGGFPGGGGVICGGAGVTWGGPLQSGHQGAHGGSWGGTCQLHPAGTLQLWSNQKVHLLGYSLLLKAVPHAQGLLIGAHCPTSGPGAHCQ